MNSYWKEKEEVKEKCIYCRHYVVPKVRDYENTKRKICPSCGATLEITIKKKKLTQRDW